jgi:hypothetical protein
MGQGHVFTAGSAALKAACAAALALSPAVLSPAVLSPAVAQGPGYRERFAFMHLELRRAEVLRELAGRDQAVRAAVAADLLAPDQGNPFRPVAVALARLRGVECDAAFLLRACVGAFVLPEVVDPGGKNENCQRGNVSVFTPYLLPDVGRVVIVVELVDRAGEVLHTHRIEQDTAAEDLRQAKARMRVPGERLDDGAYRLRIRTVIGDGQPRPGDPVLEHTFFVQRGYQARTEAALQAAVEAADALPPLPRAQLGGLAAEVRRAYAGEAFDGFPDSVQDLARLELALRNVREQKPIATGMSGFVAMAVPNGASPPGQLAAVVRFPAGARKPLVVFAGGVPAYDAGTNRPLVPGARSPRWLWRDLALFDETGRFHVAFLESPGNGVDYARALESAMAALTELLGARREDTVLVLEREAAAAACLQTKLMAGLAGVVLVGGGILAAPDLPRLGALPLLACPSSAPSSDGLRRIRDLVAGKYGPVEFQGRFVFDDAQSRPWPFGLALCQDAIRSFVVDVTGR